MNQDIEVGDLVLLDTETYTLSKGALGIVRRGKIIGRYEIEWLDLEGDNDIDWSNKWWPEQYLKKVG